jgi:Sulfotransferase domain
MNSLLRLSMWSGPRNISTAMMRAWGNRPDTVVCDEPLYAHYLHATGKAHPGASEVIAAGPTDAAQAIERMRLPIPDGKSIYYYKQMSHHLLPGMDRAWMKSMSHVFLIRDPREVIASYIKHVDTLALEDTGYPQQLEIFQLVRSWTGKPPPVVDARDALENPRAILTRLCEAVNVAFVDEMLSWPPGPRNTDGIWGKYWYKEVYATTSFQPYEAKDRPIPLRLRGLLDACQDYYLRLHEHRLTA